MENFIVKPVVLIVDDQQEHVEILVQILDELYELRVALNGPEALQVAESAHAPDLILLDIMMPGMGGYEVCRRLKSNDRTKDIPVLFVTSLNDVEDETKGLELGAIDYITKPFSPATVRARIKNHLKTKRQKDLLEDLCSIDDLTCIPNRRRFNETLENEWSRCIRSNKPISLLIVDIDFFKAYNDKYGHVAGDECLSLVARTLSESMRRGGDLAARYGGEEFAVLLPETDLGGAEEVANILNKRIEALNITHSHSRVADRITVSIGVAAMAPSPDALPETLVKAADAALYQAKENGRNQVRTQIL